MAETIVIDLLVKKILSKVISLAAEEITLVLNLEKDIKGLQDSLTMIRDVLRDSEEQQTKMISIRRWLNKLKELAYNAEDVFDELAYENLRRKVEGGMQDQPEMVESSLNLFSKFIFCAKSPVFRHKIAQDVKTINQSLAKIQKEAAGFGLQVISSRDPIMPQIDLDRVTDSVLDDRVEGREADVSRIVDLLNCSCNQQILTIVPIVGVGGLGKTALAKLVCQEVMTRKPFDVKIWICVSSNFDQQKILGEMLQSLNRNVGRLTNRDPILEELEKELKEKKFFLVLDDMWDDMCGRWDDLKTRLLKISSNNGNAIVATTRSMNVASKLVELTPKSTSASKSAETSFQYKHELDVLSHDQCWSIIKKKVFGDEEESIPSDLEEIGLEIAGKCGGLPLVAKILGGILLNVGRKRQAWMSIKNSNVLDASHNKDKVKATLQLSFDHLAPRWKPCFAYCSIFPKDSLIGKEQLIQLWMAEGFVEPCNEEEGENYFKALLCNSFFQDVERDEIQNIESCKMHDLVHDLSMSLSEHETLTSDNCYSGVDLSNIRHINVDGEDVMNSIASVGRKLHTLFFSKAIVFDNSWDLKNLRVLNLECSQIEELPSSIGEWKLLRYIDVSRTPIKALPESITKLYNLQTLRFIGCKQLEELPREKMKNLLSLKHLVFSEDKHMPSGLGRLTCLERLSLFVVCNDRGGGINELEGLNKLRGKLIIKQLEKVGENEEAKRANLEEKEIKYLQLEWNDSYHYREDYSHHEEVLEVLQPHPNIESLKIKNYKHSKFPEWVNMMKVPSEGNSFTLLNNLIELELFDCYNCEQMPSLGNLQSLKCLSIKNMQKVKCIGNEFYGTDSVETNGRKLVVFPALERLSLDGLSTLVKWRAPEGGNADFVAFPCLEELTISHCYELTEIPEHLQCLTSLKSLKLYDFRQMKELPEWIGNLSSLQSLRIHRCFKLKKLPTATAMKRLTKLTLLWIEWDDRVDSLEVFLYDSMEFNSLKRGLETKSGPEWDKISHIPNIISYIY